MQVVNGCRVVQRTITKKVLEIVYTNKTITEDKLFNIYNNIMCDDFIGSARVPNKGQYFGNMQFGCRRPWHLCHL